MVKAVTSIEESLCSSLASRLGAEYPESSSVADWIKTAF
jgi:hypothetical protein